MHISEAIVEGGTFLVVESVIKNFELAKIIMVIVYPRLELLG